MHSLLIVASLASLATPVATRDLPRQITPKACMPGADKASTPQRVGPQKLGELPPAQEYKAVWRTDARGCPDPIVVRRDPGHR
jgi:hypothetical protein